MVRSEVQLRLRRKHRIPWRSAKERWDYRTLHEGYRLYRMIGKVATSRLSHECRRKKTVGEPYMGKPYVRFDEGKQETGLVRVPRLLPTLPKPRYLRTDAEPCEVCVSARLQAKLLPA